jgi:Sec-independent protein translocase protein TatA
MEIGILVLILILIFGTRRAGRILRQGFDTYRRLDKTRQDLKKSFSLTNLFRRDDK